VAEGHTVPTDSLGVNTEKNWGGRSHGGPHVTRGPLGVKGEQKKEKKKKEIWTATSALVRD